MGLRRAPTEEHARAARSGPGTPLCVTDHFTHTAFSHRSPAELVTAAVPFIEGGLAAGDRVFVNLSAARRAVLEAALGGAAPRVRWSDTTRWYPHPARRLRAIQDLVDDEVCAGATLRFVGECGWANDPPELVAEWERFDAVLNDVLADAPLTMLCVYDAAGLPADLVARVAETHPLLGHGPAAPSPAYVGAEGFLTAHAARPLAVPAEARWLRGRVTPAEARAHVRAELSGGGSLAPAAVDDLVVAVTEIVTNSWRANAERVEVATWRAGAETAIQVEDDGCGFDNLMAGYRRPAADADGGRGLWIARQLADLVEVWSTPGRTQICLRTFARARRPRG